MRLFRFRVNVARSPRAVENQAVLRRLTDLLASLQAKAAGLH
jgi:hypothetical protein